MNVHVCTGYGQQVHAYHSAHVGVRGKPRSPNRCVIVRSLLLLLLHRGGFWNSGPRFARQVILICWSISLAQTVFLRKALIDLEIANLTEVQGASLPHQY